MTDLASPSGSSSGKWNVLGSITMLLSVRVYAFIAAKGATNDNFSLFRVRGGILSSFCPVFTETVHTLHN